MPKEDDNRLSEEPADEADVFELGQDSPTEPDFEYDEEAVNLVADFKAHPEGREALKRISNQCLQEFQNAWEATEKYRKSMGDIWKLFSGTLDDKRDPAFQHMANAHVPILLENIQRMTSRQSHELFGNWTNVFGVTPIGPDDEKIAKLLTLHGNWQLRKKIKDFKRQMHRGLEAFALFGDVTCHSFWDPQRRSNRHEMLTANEFVCANAHVSTMPDYSDVAWVAKLVRMDAHELRKMSQWEDLETTLKRLPMSYDEGENTSHLREAVDKSVGVDQTAYQSGQYEIVQFEGWLNLPGQDRDRYCQAMIDKGSQAVLSLSIWERIDPYDKRRFEFELKQQQAWQAAMQEQQAFLQEQEQTRMSALAMAHDMDPAGDGPAQGIAMARAVEEMPPPPVPPMPDWMQGNPEAVPREPDYVPIRMFTHFVNIEPMQGILGLGTGSILAPFNKAANVALSQFSDQATFNNMKNFLTTADVRFPNDGGKLVLRPGGVHKVTGSIDLQKDVMPLEFGEANAQLVQLVEMCMRFGSSVSNTPEVLSGEPGKSGETMGGISARIEQATKMLSVPTGKFADGLSNVLENNATLNAIFLEDVEFFSVNNHDPALGELGRQQFSVGREMYDRPYDVEISADLKFTSTQQRISEADALVQLPGAGPVAPAMGGNFAFLYDTIRKSLEARNRYDLVSAMGQRPEPPQFFGLPSSPLAPPPGMAPPPGAAPPGQGPPQQGAPPGA